MMGNPKMIVRLIATWHNRRSRRNQGWAWLFVMNQNRTSCSWSEWFDLRIEKLKNVHSPIMKEDVKLYGPLERFWVTIMRGMSIFQLNPSLGWNPCMETKQSILRWGWVEKKYSIPSWFKLRIVPMAHRVTHPLSFWGYEHSWVALSGDQTTHSMSMKFGSDSSQSHAHPWFLRDLLLCQVATSPTTP